MKLRIIYNPTSGKNRRNPGFRAILGDFIASQELDAEISVTEGPRHATELAREAVASGCERVVAVGGAVDGLAVQDDHELAAHPIGIGAKPGRQIMCRQRHHGLELFRQLAAQAEGTGSTGLRQVLGERFDAVRRLEKNLRHRRSGACQQRR